MYYKLSENIGLRRWKYVDRAIYMKGVDHALNISSEAFDILLKCDGKHDLEENDLIKMLLDKGYIEEGTEVSEWSKLHEYDNYYFPKMNLMITGKCNLNCLHCFNAKDNEKLNTELSFEEIVRLLDQAEKIGVIAFTLTGGEPLFHKRFLDIVKEIYKRNMHVFELNTNGLLLTQSLLDEFKKIGCKPLIKISFDGVGYHNEIRQNAKAEELTLKAIKLCIDNGFKVKAQTQVNKQNIHTIMKTAKVLNDLGVWEMRLIRTTEAPRWEKNAPNSTISIEDYYQKMLDFAYDYMHKGINMIVDIWQFMTIYPEEGHYHLSPISSNIDDFNLRIPVCKGNRGMIGISSSGEVVPCLQMSGFLMEKGISLANIKKVSLKEALANSEYINIAMGTLLNRVLNNDTCADCEYFKACTGGCQALGLLYSQNGDFYHEDITKCVFFKKGWYQKVLDKMKEFYLLNPLNIDESLNKFLPYKMLTNLKLNKEKAKDFNFVYQKAKEIETVPEGRANHLALMLYIIKKLQDFGLKFYVKGGILLQIYLKDKARFTNDIDIVIADLDDFNQKLQAFLDSFEGDVKIKLISHHKFEESSEYFYNYFNYKLNVTFKDGSEEMIVIDGICEDFAKEIEPLRYKLPYVLADNGYYLGVPIEYTIAEKILAITSELKRPYKHLIDLYSCSKLDIFDNEKILKYLNLINDKENLVRRRFNMKERPLKNNIPPFKMFDGSFYLASLQSGYKISLEEMIKAVNDWLKTII